MANLAGDNYGMNGTVPSSMPFTNPTSVSGELSPTDLSLILAPQVGSMPNFLSSNSPLPLSNSSFYVNKISIHHQDAEVSIADANDCLRMVSGKIDWFHRKHCFCPHLISPEDAGQIAALHRKILIEEVPFLELQERIRNGMVVDIPPELVGRVESVCGLFDELKHRIGHLVNNFATSCCAHVVSSRSSSTTVSPTPMPVSNQ